MRQTINQSFPVGIAKVTVQVGMPDGTSCEFAWSVRGLSFSIMSDVEKRELGEELQYRTVGRPALLLHGWLAESDSGAAVGDDKSKEIV